MEKVFEKNFENTLRKAFFRSVSCAAPSDGSPPLCGADGLYVAYI